MGSIGWVRPSAWHWLVSSTQITRALSGGLRQANHIAQPLDEERVGRELETLGAVAGQRAESSAALGAAGLSLTTVCMPLCVEPPAGFVMRSTSILRGLPGRTSSFKQAMRRSMKRVRHLPMVALGQRHAIGKGSPSDCSMRCSPVC